MMSWRYRSASCSKQDDLWRTSYDQKRFRDIDLDWPFMVKNVMGLCMGDRGVVQHFVITSDHFGDRWTRRRTA